MKIKIIIIIKRNLSEFKSRLYNPLLIEINKYFINIGYPGIKSDQMEIVFHIIKGSKIFYPDKTKIIHP
jgi:hypothetical protein